MTESLGWTETFALLYLWSCLQRRLRQATSYSKLLQITWSDLMLDWCLRESTSHRGSVVYHSYGGMVDMWHRNICWSMKIHMMPFQEHGNTTGSTLFCPKLRMLKKKVKHGWKCLLCGSAWKYSSCKKNWLKRNTWFHWTRIARTNWVAMRVQSCRTVWLSKSMFGKSRCARPGCAVILFASCWPKAFQKK